MKLSKLTFTPEGALKLLKSMRLIPVLKLKTVFTIFVFSCFINITYCSAQQLPNQVEAQEYVDNLLLTYNSLVKSYKLSNPYFDSYKDKFLLYLEEGQSFQVIFVKVDVNDSKILNLMFSHIQEKYPVVILNYNHTLSDYFPIKLGGYWSIFQGGLIEYFDMILFVHLIVSVPSIEISNMTLVNSKNLAEYLFNNNKNDVKIARINEIWDPFIKENRDVINDFNLYQKYLNISYNIRMNEDYVYDLFLIDFNEFKIIINHYKDMPIMLNRLDIFINSDDFQKPFIKNDDLIQGELTKIKDDINSNEFYLLENYEKDIQSLENIIFNKIKKRVSFNNLIYTIFILIFGSGLFWRIKDSQRIKKFFRARILKWNSRNPSSSFIS